MCTCEIQWIDAKGNPTPDTNKAIGRVMCKAHTFYFPSGRPANISASAWFNICEFHVRELVKPNMVHWIFEPFTPK